MDRRRLALKPFVKWAGGKTQLLGDLVAIFPRDAGLTKYCEPFVGGGALFFEVLSEGMFEEYYISDVNAALINAYRMIQGRVSEVIARLSVLREEYLALAEEGRRKYYYAKRARFNAAAAEGDPVEHAALFIFLNKTCFNGLYRVNRDGHFNVPMGAYRQPAIFEEENLINLSEALRRAEIVCGDFSAAGKFIDEHTFVYLDPPYKPLSKTSNFTSYSEEDFGDAEQVRLRAFFGEMDARGAKLALSNSDPKNVDPDDDFFDELYRVYSIRRLKASRMINSNAKGRGQITEILISNFEVEA